MKDESEHTPTESGGNCDCHPLRFAERSVDNVIDCLFTKMTVDRKPEDPKHNPITIVILGVTFLMYRKR